MLKHVLAVVLFAALVSARGHIKKSDSFRLLYEGKIIGGKKLNKMGIILPHDRKGAPKACLDADFGDSPGMARIKKGAKNKFYICAFVNFQHHVGDDKVSEPYTQDTVNTRFDLFKKCVDDVNQLNNEESDSATYGINFFCDLTDAEANSFYSGFIMPSDQPETEEYSVSVEDLNNIGIFLPTGVLPEVAKFCLDVELGETPGLADIVEGSHDQSYACPFVNFQSRIGEDKASDPYTQKTVDERFGYFKKCVDKVNKLNKNEEDGATYGINFFCDLSEEEKVPYHSGRVVQD